MTGQPWSGYNWYDGGLRSRVDLNVDLPIRGPDLVAHAGPRDVRRAPPRARLARGRAGRAAGPARGERHADQHPRVPHQRGPGRGRPATDPRPGRRGGPPRRARSAGPGCPMRADRAAAREMADRAVAIGPPPVGVAGGRRRCGADAPRRRARPRRGRRLARAGRACCRPNARPASSSSSSIRCGGRTPSSTPTGAELLSALAGRGPGAEIGRPGSGGCSSSRSASPTIVRETTIAADAGRGRLTATYFRGCP